MGFLRNYHGSWLREIWSVEPMPGIENLNQDEYNLIVLLTCIIGRSVNDPNQMPWTLRGAFPDLSKSICEIAKRGYLRGITTDDKLCSFSVPQLRELAKRNNLPHKGKRAELLSVVSESVPLEQINSLFDPVSECYMPSETGKRYIHALFEERFLAERTSFICLCKGNISQCIRIRAAYEARQPIQDGINVSWEDAVKHPEATTLYRDMSYILDYGMTLEHNYVAWCRLWSGGAQLVLDDLYPDVVDIV